MPAPFTIDPVLTGLIIAYQNGEYIADRVLPRLDPVLPKSEFKYSKFDFGEATALISTKVGRKGTPNEIEVNMTDTPSYTEDFALDGLVPNDDITQAPPNYDPIAASATRTWDQVQLDREVRAAGIIFNATTYPAANRTVLSGTSQWSDANSNPIRAVGDARDQMVMAPNVMAIGQLGWTALRRNPVIISSISFSGTSNGMASLRAVADLLELDDIIVGKAWQNTARRGQTAAMGRIWGKHAALLRLDKLANSQGAVPTFGYTAQYGSRVAGQMPDPKIGMRGGVRVRAGESVREVVCAPDLGFFFQNVAA
jgi:hypothetical protein